MKQNKKQKVRFLSVLLGIFRSSLLGNLLTGKGAIETSRVKDASSQRSLLRDLTCLNEAQIELMKEQLEPSRVFNETLSYNKFWNTKVLSK